MARAARNQTQNQGEGSDQGDTTPAAPKSLSLLAQEQFGDDYHGDVEPPKEPPKPEPEPAPIEEPPLPDDDEDLGGGEENIQGEGEEKAEAAKPADEADDAEPIATVRELVEHLEADPGWFEGLKFDVMVDDKTSQVPLRDLVVSYQQNQAADERLERAKTKLAQVQEEAAQRSADIEAEFQKAAKLVLMQEQQLMQEVSGVNWDQLHAEDPAMWSAKRVALKERYDQIQNAKAYTAREYEQTRVKQHQEDQNSRAATEQEQKQLLLNAMPKISKDWGEPQKVPEAKTRLQSYLVGQYGYSLQEIGNTLDHRNFLIAEKARLWDESQGKVQVTKKRIATVPRVMKPGARKEPATVNREKVLELKQKLRSSGRMEDALTLLRAQQSRR